MHKIYTCMHAHTYTHSLIHTHTVLVVMIHWMLMVGLIFPRVSQGTQFSSSCLLISWTFVSTSQLPQEATDSEEEADTNDSDDEDDSDSITKRHGFSSSVRWIQGSKTSTCTLVTHTLHTHTHTHTLTHTLTHKHSSKNVTLSTTSEPIHITAFQGANRPLRTVPNTIKAIIFTLFFNTFVLDIIVTESNRYAQQCVGESYLQWTPMTLEELEAYMDSWS